MITEHSALLVADSVGPPPTPPAGSSPDRGGRGPARIAAIILVLVLVAGMAFLFGRRIESPEQAVANAQPPPPSLISVPIEERVLGDEFTFRADINSDGTEDVVIASAEAQPIITEVLVAPGDTVKEGDALLAFNGRRVIAFAGELPMYRDLVPFVEGPDVSQLQQSLVRLGYSVGASGVFDAITQKSSLAVLREAGLVLEASGNREQRQAVDGARAALRAASDGVIASREALTAAKEANLLAIAMADDLVEEATETQRLVMLASDQKEARAKSDLETKKQALDSSIVDGSPAAIAKAETAVQNAKDSVELTAAEVNIDRQTARRTLESATSAAVRARGASFSAFERALTAAEEGVRSAQAELDAALRAAGVTIPQYTFHYVSTLPARVISVGAIPGVALGELAGPSLQLSNGSLVAVARVDHESASQLSVGLKVEASLSGTVAEGTIATIEGPDSEGENVSEMKVRIEFSQPLPEAWRGGNVKAVVVVNRTKEAVMVVPSSGIFSDPAGQTYVRRLTSSGATEQVLVSVGVVAQGYVEIESLTEKGLRVGDAVVVGSQ